MLVFWQYSEADNDVIVIDDAGDDGDEGDDVNRRVVATNLA